MLIVSQDKKYILNFNTVAEIYRSANTICCVILDKSDILGKYATEERAVEVLREIVERYKYIQRMKWFGEFDFYEVGINDFTYEMPEK